MMLAARTGAWAKSGGEWVNPYITDGLIAMWDGEWNAGGGVHDSNATVWKDIVGNHDMSYSAGAPVWEAKSAVFDGSHSWSRTVSTDDFISANGTTVEVAFVKIGNSTNNGIFSVNPGIGANRLLWVYVSYTQGSNMSGAYFYNNVNIGSSLQGVESGKIVTIGIRHDGATTASAYLNNSSFASASVAGVQSSTRTLNFGSNGYGRFNGLLSSVRWYNRALTNSEIAANYAVDKARFNLA